MVKSAKSDALRKKREAKTDNVCKHCGSKGHKSEKCKEEMEESE